ADYVAVEIHQRPAAVAGIDRGIRLDEILAVGNADPAILRTDDAGRDRAFQSERLAEGQHPIADLDLAAVAKPGGRKGACTFDAQNGQIGFRVGFDIDGLELPDILQPDHDLAVACNDVPVCEYDSCRID